MQSVSTRKTHHMGIIIIHVNILELIMVAIRRTCTEASCTTVRGEREAIVSGMQSLHNIRARALSRYSACTRARGFNVCVCCQSASTLVMSSSRYSEENIWAQTFKILPF